MTMNNKKPSSWRANKEALDKIKPIPINGFYMGNGSNSGNVHYKKRGSGDLTKVKLHQYLNIKLMKC